MENVKYRVYLPLFTLVCSCSNYDSTEVTNNELSSIKGIFYPDLNSEQGPKESKNGNEEIKKCKKYKDYEAMLNEFSLDESTKSEILELQESYDEKCINGTCDSVFLWLKSHFECDKNEQDEYVKACAKLWEKVAQQLKEGELKKYERFAELNKNRTSSFNDGRGIKPYEILLYLETVYKSLAKYKQGSIKGKEKGKYEAINNLMGRIEECHSSILQTINEGNKVSCLQLTKGFIVVYLCRCISKESSPTSFINRVVKYCDFVDNLLKFASETDFTTNTHEFKLESLRADIYVPNLGFTCGFGAHYNLLMHISKFVKEFNENTEKLLQEMQKIKTKITQDTALSSNDLEIIQKLKFIKKLCAFNNELNKESDYEKRKGIMLKYLKVPEYSDKIKRLCTKDFYADNYNCAFDLTFEWCSDFTLPLFDYLNDDYNHMCLFNETSGVELFPAIFLNSANLPTPFTINDTLTIVQLKHPDDYLKYFQSESYLCKGIICNINNAIDVVHNRCYCLPESISDENKIELVLYDDYRKNVEKFSKKLNEKGNVLYAVFEKSDNKSLNEKVNKTVLDNFVTPGKEYINTFRKVLNKESYKEFCDSLYDLDFNLLCSNKSINNFQEMFFKDINGLTNYLRYIPEENIDKFRYLWRHVWGLDVDKQEDKVVIKKLIDKNTLLKDNEKAKIKEAPLFKDHTLLDNSRLCKLLYYINSQSSDEEDVKK